MGRYVDGQVGGWRDGWKYGQIMCRQVNGQIDSQKNRQTDGWMEICVDRETDRQGCTLDGQTDKCMDRKLLIG